MTTTENIVDVYPENLFEVSWFTVVESMEGEVEIFFGKYFGKDELGTDLSAMISDLNEKSQEVLKLSCLHSLEQLRRINKKSRQSKPKAALCLSRRGLKICGMPAGNIIVNYRWSDFGVVTPDDKTPCNRSLAFMMSGAKGHEIVGFKTNTDTKAIVVVHAIFEFKNRTQSRAWVQRTMVRKSSSSLQQEKDRKDPSEDPHHYTLVVSDNKKNEKREVARQQVLAEEKQETKVKVSSQKPGCLPDVVDAVPAQQQPPAVEADLMQFDAEGDRPGGLDAGYKTLLADLLQEGVATRKSASQNLAVGGTVVSVASNLRVSSSKKNPALPPRVPQDSCLHHLTQDPRELPNLGANPSTGGAGKSAFEKYKSQSGQNSGAACTLSKSQIPGTQREAQAHPATLAPVNLRSSSKQNKSTTSLQSMNSLAGMDRICHGESYDSMAELQGILGSDKLSQSRKSSSSDSQTSRSNSMCFAVIPPSEQEQKQMAAKAEPATSLLKPKPTLQPSNHSSPRCQTNAAGSNQSLPASAAQLSSQQTQSSQIPDPFGPIEEDLSAFLAPLQSPKSSTNQQVDLNYLLDCPPPLPPRNPNMVKEDEGCLYGNVIPYERRKANVERIMKRLAPKPHIPSISRRMPLTCPKS